MSLRRLLAFRCLWRHDLEYIVYRRWRCRRCGAEFELSWTETRFLGVPKNTRK